MRETFLSFNPPMVGEEEIAAVVETLRSGWVTTGKKTLEFEAAFGARVGAPGSAAVSSCTAALHLALVLRGVGAGDEVIVPAVTFAATANVVEHVGAKPVIVDVERETLNLDPLAVERAITSKTKALVAVHFAGHPAELDSLRALAKRHGLGLIEDAAHAFPAAYRGRAIGSSADSLAAFSFYATKNLTTLEGGMLTGEPALIERARRLSLHGLSRGAWNRYGEGGSWSYEILEPGYKYNLTDVQAAVGLTQLAKIDAFHARRKALARTYREGLAGCDAIELPVERPEVESAWHLFVIRLREESLAIGRDEFIQRLAKRRIGASVHFIPLHLHPFYRDRYGYRAEGLPVAYGEFKRLVSLPFHPGLGDQDARDVIEAVLETAREAKR